MTHTCTNKLYVISKHVPVESLTKLLKCMLNINLWWLPHKLKSINEDHFLKCFVRQVEYTYPLHVRMGSNANNPGSRELREVIVLELITNCPWNQVTCRLLSLSKCRHHWRFGDLAFQCYLRANYILAPITTCDYLRHSNWHTFFFNFCELFFVMHNIGYCISLIFNKSFSKIFL